MLTALILVLVPALGGLGFLLATGGIRVHHRLPEEIGGYPTPMLALTVVSAAAFIALSTL